MSEDEKEGWYGTAKRLALIKQPLTERMIDMSKIVCCKKREQREMWFGPEMWSCCLPQGHEGDDILRPEWETYAVLRFIIGAGYYNAPKGAVIP